MNATSSGIRSSVRKPCAILFIPILALLFFAAQLIAQSGKIDGVVKDQHQAVVLGAVVNLTNSQSGVRRSTTTNSQGEFSFNAVQDGTYKIEVEAKGFQTLTKADLAVRAGGQAHFDFVLKVGTASTKVIVAAPAYYSAEQSFGPFGDQTAQDLPYASNSIPLELIQDQQAKSVDDILRNDPSVSVVEPSSSVTDSGSPRYNIRGFVVDYGAARIDGMNTFSVMPPVEGIERVDVLKGSTAVLYGFGTPGGVINAVLKKPLETPFNEISLYSTGDRGQFEGSIDLSRRFGPKDQFGGRIIFAKENGDGPVNLTTIDRNYEAVALDWRPVSGLRVWTRLDHSGNNRNGIGGYLYTYAYSSAVTQFPSAPDPTTLLGQPWTYENTGTTSEEAGFTYDKDGWLVQLEYGLSHTSNKQLLTSMVLTDSQSYSVTPQAQNYSVRGKNLNMLLNHKFKLGPTLHDVSVAPTWGLSAWMYSPVATGTSLGTSSIYSPTYFTPTSLPVAGSISGLSDWRNMTEVATDRIQYGEHWAALVGLTHADYQTGPSPSGRGQSAFDPMGGLVYKPVKWVTTYGSYVSALQMGAQAPSTAANAGQYLPPYDGKQYEFGSKMAIPHFAEVDAAFFIIDQAYAFLDPADNVYKSAGSQLNKGFELVVSKKITDNLAVFGGFMDQTAKIQSIGGKLVTGPDNKVLGVPNFKSNLFLEYSIPSTHGLSVMGGFNNVGQTPAAAKLSHTVYWYLPSYTTVDLGAKYEFVGPSEKPLALRFYAQNVANKAYWGGNTFSGYVLQVGDPRTIKGSLTMRF